MCRSLIGVLLLVVVVVHVQIYSWCHGDTSQTWPRKDTCHCQRVLQPSITQRHMWLDAKMMLTFITSSLARNTNKSTRLESPWTVAYEI